MTYTSKTPQLARKDRSSAYKLAAQFGDAITIMMIIDEALEDGRGLTLTNAI